MRCIGLDFSPLFCPPPAICANSADLCHRHNLADCREKQTMGLLGCYSNPEIQARLRQLSDKLDGLAASDAAPLPSARRDQKLRGGLVPKAIERVMVACGEPMRARDVHAEVEELLGMPGRPPRSRTGWPSRLRISSPESYGWDAGGTGWSNALFAWAWRCCCDREQLLGGPARCGRLGARRLRERWLAVAAM